MGFCDGSVQFIKDSISTAPFNPATGDPIGVTLDANGVLYLGPARRRASGRRSRAATAARSSSSDAVLIRTDRRRPRDAIKPAPAGRLTARGAVARGRRPFARRLRLRRIATGTVPLQPGIPSHATHSEPSAFHELDGA